jgi:NDP-sugar pyrophosphorylase family protein
VKTFLAMSLSGMCLAPLDVFVLAGGLGTRIRPVLGDTPKLLAMLSGRPYLDHLLDRLHGFGARRILLGLGHRAEAVIDHLRTHPRSELELSYVIEPHPLGTAGALRYARKELSSDPVMVVNGDSFADADLCGMVARQRNSGATGTVLCAEVADASRYGRVVLDQAGFIQHFVEKDTAFHGPAPVNAGVYLLSAVLLDQIAGDQSVSLENDVFGRLPPRSLAAYTGRFHFVDIGTPESLELARVIFESRNGSKRTVGRVR